MRISARSTAVRATEISRLPTAVKPASVIAGDDAEYRHHRRVPPEVVHPEVAEEQNGRREAECGADPEADTRG